MATKKEKWDGRSRPSNDQYQKNYDEIFKKNLEGSVINLEESFTSKDFYEETQKENEELEESFKESQRQTKERTKPLASFSKDLQESIKKRTYAKRKDHATDMSYENESKKK
tara:strand:+ start:309 stop:644 length:336 start_codon:yes stop_codon:yes gene_type:complete